MINRILNRSSGPKPPKAFGGNPLATPLMLALAAGLFLSFIGVPYLRTHYVYRPAGQDRAYLYATYQTFGGKFVASPSELGLDTCPLIVFRPLETSLIERFARLWRNEETSNPAK